MLRPSSDRIACVCACGVPFHSSRHSIRDWAARGMTPLCARCLSKHRAELARKHRSGIAPPRARVKAEDREMCQRCHGMSWRRPKRGTCLGCGGRYESEPPVTLAYVESLPRDAARVLPEGGGFR